MDYYGLPEEIVVFPSSLFPYSRLPVCYGTTGLHHRVSPRAMVGSEISKGNPVVQLALAVEALHRRCIHNSVGVGVNGTVMLNTTESPGDGAKNRSSI